MFIPSRGTNYIVDNKLTMELIYQPAFRRERCATDDGDAAVAAASSALSAVAASAARTRAAAVATLSASKASVART